MATKSNFGPDLGPFCPNFSPRVLPLEDVRHCYPRMQFQGNLMIQTQESLIGPLTPNSGRHFFFFF